MGEGCRNEIACGAIRSRSSERRSLRLTFSRLKVPQKTTRQRPCAPPQKGGVLLSEAFGRRNSSGSIGHPGERSRCEGSERVLHHPAYRVFLEVLRQEAGRTHSIDPLSAICLVSEGAQGLSRHWGCSDRTVRRRLRTECDGPKAFVKRVRLRLTIALLAREVPTSVVARWLGFSGAGAYRRRDVSTTLRQRRVEFTEQLVPSRWARSSGG